MIYIKILEEFQNVHNKNETYHVNEIVEVSEERYEEILKNMNKLNMKLIKKATKKEVEEFINKQDIENIESASDENNDAFEGEQND